MISRAARRAADLETVEGRQGLLLRLCYRVRLLHPLYLALRVIRALIM